MYKTVEPKKRQTKPQGMGAYVRITPRMFFISNDAGKAWGDHEHCRISIDAPGKMMVVAPSEDGWKLSTVCHTKHAKRIETRNSTISFLDAGFPKGLLGKYLPCNVDLAGRLIVGLNVDYDRMEQ